MNRSSFALVCLVGALGGCASWFMNGGKLVDKSYAPSAKATYSVPSCTNLVDGSSLKGPDSTYLVVLDGAKVGLFERAADGSGAVIENQWSDDQGDHFFGWVQSTGWEYVVPKDASAPATRLVYTNVKTSKEGEVTKPTSAPVAKCPMVPVK